jgi:arylsulfatase
MEAGKGMTGKQNPRSYLSRREMLKRSLALGLTGGLSLVGCQKRPREGWPSIFLITVDTLRADHLGCHGYSRNTSPNIDQFARDALLFENCLSHAPATRCSFASMLSGFLPHETRTLKHNTVPREVDTLPEILRRQGYKTAAVVGNYVLRRKRGFEQGFMIYDDTMNERELVRPWPERTAEPTTDRAIELLDRFRNNHLFMWIHYQDPHGPYTPPGPFAQQFQDPDQEPRNLPVNDSLSGEGGIPSYQQLESNTDFHYYVSQYDGEIRYQDEQFGRLIDAMKEFGFYDDALIIFSSDHGEELGERDYYFCHGENLYHSLLHVPLVVKYGNELRGRRTDFVQHIDIVPTVLEVLDVETNLPFRGRDLRLQSGPNKAIFAEMNSPLSKDGRKFSLVVDGYKLIYTAASDKLQLFDLAKDPGEAQDLAENPDYEERKNVLKTKLDRIRTEDLLRLRTAGKSLKLSDEEKRKLKDLGYTR